MSLLVSQGVLVLVGCDMGDCSWSRGLAFQGRDPLWPEPSIWLLDSSSRRLGLRVHVRVVPSSQRFEYLLPGQESTRCRVTSSYKRILIKSQLGDTINLLQGPGDRALKVKPLAHITRWEASEPGLGLSGQLCPFCCITGASARRWAQRYNRRVCLGEAPFLRVCWQRTPGVWVPRMRS